MSSKGCLPNRGGPEVSTVLTVQAVRCTIPPAQRLHGHSQEMRRKGKRLIHQTPRRTGYEAAVKCIQTTAFPGDTWGEV